MRKCDCQERERLPNEKMCDEWKRMIIEKEQKHMKKKYSAYNIERKRHYKINKTFMTTEREKKFEEEEKKELAR